jgi:hypothetical protein
MALAATHTILFSGETVFPEVADKVADIARLKGVLDIRLLLVVREPFEHLQSIYQQRVKRAGEFGTIDDMASRLSHIEQAADIVRLCHDHGVPITLLNYSKHRHDIIDQVLLTLPNGPALVHALEDQDRTAIVNRSMTLSELNLIREINRLGNIGLGILVSDALVNELPMIRSDLLPLSEAGRAALRERVTEPVRYINSFLPEAEQLTLREDAIGTDASDGGAQFSREQLHVIAKCLHKAAVPQPSPSPVLTPGPSPAPSLPLSVAHHSRPKARLRKIQRFLRLRD